MRAGCGGGGLAYFATGRTEEAIAHYQEALRLNPNYAEPHTNLGNLLKDRGELDPAISEYRRAIDLSPDLSFLHSNLLLTLHYHPDYSPADLLREHQAWADRHVQPLVATRRPHSNNAQPDRRLRIGYVTADLREHPIARFILPVLKEHELIEADSLSVAMLRQDVDRKLTLSDEELQTIWRQRSERRDVRVLLLPTSRAA